MRRIQPLVLFWLIFTLLGCATVASPSQKKLAAYPTLENESMAEKAKKALGDFPSPQETDVAADTKGSLPWSTAFLSRAVLIILGGLLLKNVIKLDENP